jgi:hypothetical protein
MMELRRAWDTSRLGPRLAALAAPVKRSAWAGAALRILERWSGGIEGVGRALQADRWTLAPSSGAWWAVAIATTLLARAALVGVFGPSGGRWWLPPGLVLVWAALGCLAYGRACPPAWHGSRVLRVARRWIP